MKQPTDQSSVQYKIWSAIDRAYVRMYQLLDVIYTGLYVRFCKVKKTKIVFDSYLGRGYGDNPKYIAEEIMKRGLNWELVWLLDDLNKPLPEGIRAVQYNSCAALRERASAGVWIDNARNFNRTPKKPGQIFLQTWHGGLNFKYVEGAAADKLKPQYVQLAKQDGKESDAIISACGLRTEEYRKYFWLNEKTEILNIGLPRNDALFDPVWVRNNSEYVRQRLGIPKEKKIILYMPTFRDDGSMDGYLTEYDRVLSTMEERFGGSFVFVVRLHPNVQKQTRSLVYSDKVYDGNIFPDAQLLYMASDYIISDYSSSAFDFALLKRPAFLYVKDSERYRKLRGLNENYDTCPFPKADSVEMLLDIIRNFSEQEYEEKFAAFQKIWQPFDDGHAAEHTVDWLKEKMIQ